MRKYVHYATPAGHPSCSAATRRSCALKPIYLNSSWCTLFFSSNSFHCSSRRRSSSFKRCINSGGACSPLLILALAKKAYTFECIVSSCLLNSASFSSSFSSLKSTSILFASLPSERSPTLTVIVLVGGCPIIYTTHCSLH